VKECRGQATTEPSHAIRYNRYIEMPDLLHQRIVRDPQICGGEPVFRGTRVTLRTVLASLADGDSAEEILADFPSLKADDIRAAISFAAASAEEDLPVPASPETLMRIQPFRR
jgi:uncharacterized protein (DUF433 family)